MSGYSRQYDTTIRWRQHLLTKRGIRFVYHLSHINNLASIMAYDLLPLNRLKKVSLESKDISMPDVQARRDARKIDLADGRSMSVHDFVPLFFRKLTPMLYKRKELRDQLCFLVYPVKAICSHEIDCVICDGNIASPRTKYWIDFGENGSNLDKINWDIVRCDRWTEYDDGSRLCAAEVLVQPKLVSSEICGIIVNSHLHSGAIRKVLYEHELLEKIIIKYSKSDFFN